MKKICVCLADGFEEIEGLTIVDLLRRAGIDVCTVSVTGAYRVHGAHSIDVMADRLFEEVDFIDVEMLVLPGGMPGTTNLKEHNGLRQVLDEFHYQEKYIAAICAAPSILGERGMLTDRQAVCYPTVEEALKDAHLIYVPAVQDGHIITGRGAGTAIDFALQLVEVLTGKETADQIADSILFNR